MSIDDNANALLEPGSENDVRGFASHAGKGEQLVHFAGYFAAKVTNDLFRCSYY